MQWKLIALRKEHNLKREQVAKMLEISDATYAMKERGDTQFKMNEMFALKQYFQLPIEDIFLPSGCTNNAIINAEKEG